MSQRAGPRTGGLIWLLWLLFARPTPRGEAWPGALILLATLVVVPLGCELCGTREEIRKWLLPAALPVAAAVLLPAGPIAAAAALPWSLATLAISIDAGARLVRLRFRPLAETATLAGPAYLVVGGAWLLADRLGLTPLGFSSVIVRLTAAHFHYAGFALPLVAGLGLGRRAGTVARAAAAGVVLGVPAVAIGITATQIGAGTAIETGAVALTSAAALLLAAVLAALARDPAAPPSSRTLWGIAAVSLAAAMILAAAYGGRFVFGAVPLDIPRMWAVHGSLNALGFAIPALAAFRLARPAS